VKEGKEKVKEMTEGEKREIERNGRD